MAAPVTFPVTVESGFLFFASLPTHNISSLVDNRHPNRYEVISHYGFANLLKFIKTCFVTQPIIYLGKCSVWSWKNVYSSAVGWNDLNMSVRYIDLVESVVQVHCFLIDFMCEWSIHCWKWGIEIPYCYCIEVYFYFQFCWLINIWRDAQHHSLLVKCKSKLQWDITSPQTEWP